MLATSRPELHVLDDSRVVDGDREWALAQTPTGLRLVVSVPASDAAQLAALEGETSAGPQAVVLTGPLSAHNAAALRRHLPWLAPRPLGLATSAGFGDRLGLATPGHIRALRVAGGAIAPVFAQQSIREMARTGRSPQDVVDAAMWGVFASGWRDGYGADADHLKTTADIDACLAAGYTCFTIDPGEHVDSRADSASPAAMEQAVQGLPWSDLEDDERSLRARYLGHAIAVEGHEVHLDEGSLRRAAVKYGRAVAHVVKMHRHLRAALPEGGFDLEVSVDETDTPTTHAEHVYVARELRRLGVRWVSLAPRFIGRFEKGVDYIGDLAAFDADFAVHAAIARTHGPYKLSLHSGSDKFSIYPSAADRTRGLVHLKTAGTSYLEALRTAAQVAPALFRAIYAFSIDKYAADRASYHVSGRSDRAPAASGLGDADLPRVLDDFDARQVLHVTYGSVLTARDDDGASLFADPLLSLLGAHAEAYALCLERHFVRHLEPFVAPSRLSRP
jgi:hypothetical protein